MVVVVGQDLGQLILITGILTKTKQKISNVIY